MVGQDEFDELYHSINLNIKKIEYTAQLLNQAVEKIGTPADTTINEAEIHELIQKSNTLPKYTNNMMKNLVSLSNGNSILKQKREILMDSLMSALNLLQDAQRKAVVKEKSKINENQLNNFNQIDDNFSDSNPFASQQLSQEQIRQKQQEIEEVKQRHSAIRQLEVDISDVNQIFKDLAKLVHEQGDMVDSIEDNIDSAQIHVEQGSTNVQQALHYQQKARQKQLLLFVFFAVLIFIILLTLWFSK
ncbi:LD23667p [Strongyloides ratti]|uniref:LD23667p n=1 Tax=Strongyloides ratti TaxID=34506 RepID=A0A090LE47_STRRB|nr:LD23667p [Strongyloides ratti]CEF66418.1 LD23667p [Strongyloides ratti]